jgi:hypothetical protein
MGLSRIRAVPELAVLRCCAPANWAYTRGRSYSIWLRQYLPAQPRGRHTPARDPADDHEALNIYIRRPASSCACATHYFRLLAGKILAASAQPGGTAQRDHLTGLACLMGAQNIQIRSGARPIRPWRPSPRRVGARYVRRFPVSVRFGPGPTEGGGHPRAQAARPAGPSARSRRGLAAAGEDIELTRPGKSHPSVMLAG